MGEVSFDGKSYYPIVPSARPGRRELPNPAGSASTKTHLELRRQAETNSSSLWRIHEKFYDLEPYLDVHPGGRPWLELTRGTDATAAFEAHHLDGPRVEAVLQQYYVRDVVEGEFEYGDRFTYAEDGFWRTLRRRVLEHLRKEAGPGCTTQEATAATVSMRAACAIVLMQYTAAHSLARSTGSALAAALAGFFLAGCWGVGHNFMHQSDAKGFPWRYAMALIGSFPHQERISHALSHHLEPNLSTDWEQQFLVSDYLSEKGPMSTLQAALLPFMVGPTGLAKGAKTMGSMGDGRALADVLAPMLPWLQFLSYATGRGSLGKGFVLFCIQAAVSFLTFIPHALGVHHSAPEPGSKELAEMEQLPAPRATLAWHHGQAGEKLDFGEHQVTATTDHSVFFAGLPDFVQNYLSLTLYGNLNNHKLHHLFPAVDHSRLRSLRAVFDQTAAEFGLDNKVYGVHTIFRGYWRYVLGRRRRSRL